MIALKEESLIVGGVERKEDKIAERMFDLLNERLSDAVGQYGCDLHNYLFNEEQTFIYHNTAEDACERVGVFSAIRLVKKYEEDQFGESNTKIEPCDVANMLVYIYGEYILQDSNAVDEKQWDRELTAMIRIMVASGKPAVFAKEGMAHFNMVQVVVGLPLAYGWRAKDFQ